MFEISVQSSFSGAHHLKGYQGACRRVHGHNWLVEVFLRGTQLDQTGMLIDFKELKKTLSEILDALDHEDLNHLSVFTEKNPTSENLAQYIYEQLKQKLNHKNCLVHRVKVCESPGSSASYWESQ